MEDDDIVLFEIVRKNDIDGLVDYLDKADKKGISKKAIKEKIDRLMTGFICGQYKSLWYKINKKDIGDSLVIQIMCKNGFNQVDLLDFYTGWNDDVILIRVSN